MDQQQFQEQPLPPEDEIDLWELLEVILKRKKMIVALAVSMAILSAVYSLFLTNIYQANAVIQPAGGKKGGGLSALSSQFGGLASLAGISMPRSSDSSEIMALLDSNILKEEMINDYDLMPILFEDEWDQEQGQWKESTGSNYIGLLITAIKGEKDDEEKDLGPTMWDGIRRLDEILSVSKDKKGGTINVSAQFDDPDKATQILSYCLETLTNHLAESAKHAADTNKKYLEEQISKTSDPIIKQKIYELIAQQLETVMMSEVKEDFAFKVLDPPRVPDKKIKPKRSLIVVMSFMVALFLGVILAFVFEAVEKKKREQEGVL